MIIREVSNPSMGFLLTYHGRFLWYCASTIASAAGDHQEAIHANE